MTKGRHFVCAVSAAAVLSAPLCHAAPLKISKTQLTEDAVWSGEVEIGGDVYVPPGVTLTVAPGTRVTFKKIDAASDQNRNGSDYPQAELIVRGRLIAKGTPGKPITFTSAEKTPRAEDWGALNFLGGTGNVIEHCRISYAYNGVHAHGAQVAIADSELFGHAVAISVKKEDEVAGVEWFGKEADLTVTRTLIHHNKVGINFRLSRAVLTYNTIKDNQLFGIWQKGKCSGEVTHNEITGNYKGIYLFRSAGTTIERNNIYGNAAYNIAVADQQEKDQPAPNNWFGTTDRAQIASAIYDHSSDPSLAAVLVEPVLEKRVEDAGREARR